jgi:hypothetical protein
VFSLKGDYCLPFVDYRVKSYEHDILYFINYRVISNKHDILYFINYRVKSYEHENRWDKAVITYDIEICQSSSVIPQYELLRALQNFGSTHLLDKYLDTISVTGQDVPNHITDFQFQAAWKAGRWNLETISR